MHSCNVRSVRWNACDDAHCRGRQVYVDTCATLCKGGNDEQAHVFARARALVQRKASEVGVESGRVRVGGGAARFPAYMTNVLCIGAVHAILMVPQPRHDFTVVQALGDEGPAIHRARGPHKLPRAHESNETSTPPNSTLVTATV
jgi:hypothetical protein